MPFIICKAAYNVLMCILIVVMLSDSSLFNAEFITEIAKLTKGTVESEEVAKWFETIGYEQ